MKKVLSFMIVFALVITMVPLTPSFAAGFSGESTDNSYLTVAGELGASILEIKALQDISTDFITSQGTDFDNGISNLIDSLKEKNADLKTVLGDNGITKATAISDAKILKGSGSNDIYEKLESTKFDDQLNNNLLTSNYPKGSEDSLPTFLYYLIIMLDDQNVEIMTYDTYDQSLVFDFSSKLDNNTPIVDSNTEVATLNSYLKLALSSGSFDFDKIKDDLKDSLNDKLSAYLSGSNAFSAEDIKDALNACVDNFDLVDVIDSTPSTGGGGSTGDGGGTTTSDTDGGTDDTETTEPIDNTEELEEQTNETSDSISNEDSDPDELVDAVNNIVDSSDDLVEEVTEDDTEEEVAEKTAALVESVNKTTDLVNQLLERDDVDSDKAVAIVNKMIETNITKALSNTNISKKDSDALKKKAKELANNAVKKAGTLDVSEDSEVDEIKVKALIEKANATANQVKETLKKANVSSNENDVKAVVRLKSKKTDVEVSLDEKTIKTLKDGNVGLEVSSKGSKVNIPTEELQNLADDESINVKTKAVSSTINKALSNQSGGRYLYVETKDLEVRKTKANGESQQIQGLEFRFNLSDYDGDKNNISVLVFNNKTNETELVNSWVVGNEIQFKAPHFSYYSVAEYNSTFEDIDDSWASDIIIKMAAKGIVNGRSETEFDPNGNITRAEFVAMLMDAFGYSSDVYVSFKDISEDNWYYQPVNAALKLSLVNGVGEGNFNPTAEITRQDMVVMMARFFENETSEALDSETASFSDISNASNYAKAALKGAKEIEIINGYDGNIFKPMQNATRAEALKMIDNLLLYLR